MAAREMQKSEENAHALLKVFETEADKHGILYEIVREQGLSAELPALAAGYARFRDVTILPIHFDDFVNRWDTEAVIFKSGRPAILVPEGRVPREAALNAVTAQRPPWPSRPAGAASDRGPQPTPRQARGRLGRGPARSSRRHRRATVSAAG